MADEKKDNSSKVVEARSKFQSLLLNTIRFAARLEDKDHIEFRFAARSKDHIEFKLPGRSV